jgi:hypothetical protein
MACCTESKHLYTCCCIPLHYFCDLQEGLDPQTAAAVMAFLYKEKRAPGLVVIRGRIQRFKGGSGPGHLCIVFVLCM